MLMQGQSQRVTIYIGESDRLRGKNLYLALLEFLKNEGAMGATVTRGIAGFGAHRRIHTSAVVNLSFDLPVLVEWVDTPDQVERLMPQVRTMAGDGLITVETIDIAQWAPGLQPDPLAQPVSTAMHETVITVAPETPSQDVVGLLIDSGYKSLPVVDDDGQVVGIITDGDLLRLSGIQVRLSLQDSLGSAAMRQQFDDIATQAATAADIMSSPVTCISADQPMREAADLAVKQGLKRLPVVDAEDRLVGLVSRLDLLRLLDHKPLRDPDSARTRATTGATIAELMEPNAPTVLPTAHLEEVLQALERSRQLRVVVVDEEQRVLGIISDGDILQRSQQGRNPSLLGRLRNLITGGSRHAVTLPASDERAADLMTTPVVTVNQNTAPEAALTLMLRDRIKRLPVVDDEGRLLGLLGRASLLRGLLGSDNASG